MYLADCFSRNTPTIVAGKAAHFAMFLRWLTSDVEILSSKTLPFNWIDFDNKLAQGLFEHCLESDNSILLCERIFLFYKWGVECHGSYFNREIPKFWNVKRRLLYTRTRRSDNIPVPNEFEGLPTIPSIVKSRSGQEIDTRASIWNLSLAVENGASCTINWFLVEESVRASVFATRAWYLVKLYLTDCLVRRSEGTVDAYFYSIRLFENWLATNSIMPHSFNWSDLSQSIAESYNEHVIKNTSQRGVLFAALRTFYQWGIVEGFSDFDLDTFLLLKSIRTRGNARGHHVRFRDVYLGPFSADDRLLITRAIDAGCGKDEERAIVMIHLELGIRPHATARITNGDLKKYSNGNLVTYHIDVPRVKQRNGRREVKRRRITTKLGQLLERLMRGDAADPLFHWVNFAQPGGAIIRAMKRFVKAANLISPRTKELLVLHPRRFRYTLATHMAMEGASSDQIAEVLDHSDVANVEIYVETTSAITEPVAKATDAELTPLVNRFLGKLVESVDKPAFTDVPNQIIPAINPPHLPTIMLNTGGVGLCGQDVRKDGLCRLFPPLSCYICPSFGALRSGPHSEILESITTFMREEKGMIDDRILLQLEEVCIAIKQVMQKIESSKAVTVNVSEEGRFHDTSD